MTNYDEKKEKTITCRKKQKRNRVDERQVLK